MNDKDNDSVVLNGSQRSSTTGSSSLAETAKLKRILSKKKLEQL